MFLSLVWPAMFFSLFGLYSTVVLYFHVFTLVMSRGAVFPAALVYSRAEQNCNLCMITEHKTVWVEREL